MIELLKESKDGRRQPRGAVDAHFASGRNHTGEVVRQPATGGCGSSHGPRPPQTSRGDRVRRSVLEWRIRRRRSDLALERSDPGSSRTACRQHDGPASTRRGAGQEERPWLARRRRPSRALHPGSCPVPQPVRITNAETLICKVLATNADAWSFVLALSAMIFKLYYSGFWVSHAYDIPAEVVAFVCSGVLDQMSLRRPSTRSFAAMLLSPKTAMLVYIFGFTFPTIPDSDF